ncbi:hypothetical protein CHISP_3723 [Chitinispirillum alkaliphilum]|nr:hypothetical protein CHISP_3723 [Chitinispirillum alkaliphilum]
MDGKSISLAAAPSSDDLSGIFRYPFNAVVHFDKELSAGITGAQFDRPTAGILVSDIVAL